MGQFWPFPLTRWRSESRSATCWRLLIKVIEMQTKLLLVPRGLASSRIESPAHKSVAAPVHYKHQNLFIAIQHSCLCSFLLKGALRSHCSYPLSHMTALLPVSSAEHRGSLMWTLRDPGDLGCARELAASRGLVQLVFSASD